jgi:hypothetical protein
MGKALIRRSICRYFRSAVRLALRLLAPRGGFLPAAEPVLDGFSILRGTVGVSSSSSIPPTALTLAASGFPADSAVVSR